jgi:chitin synthase
MGSKDTRPPRSNPPPENPANNASGQIKQTQRPQPTGNISFHGNERGERRAPLSPASRTQQSLPPTPGAVEGGPDFADRVSRKKSLVRPDREKIEPGHRQWYYRNHAAELENNGSGRVGLLPSSRQLFTYPAHS